MNPVTMSVIRFAFRETRLNLNLPSISQTRFKSTDLHTSGGFGSKVPETDLKAVIADKIPPRLEMIRKLRLHHGSAKLQSVTVDMLYAGLRDAPVLLSETTTASREHGIRFRGLTVQEAQELLPHASDGEEPLPEAMLWLLLTGEVPTASQVAALSQELVDRENVPLELVVGMRHLPPEMEPVLQLSAALLMLSERSKMGRECRKKKTHTRDLWKPMLEDVLDLMAAMPSIIALVLQGVRSKIENIPPAERDLDWTSNLTQKMGYYDHRMEEFLRLYMSIHCDYETSNVATHCATLIGSALADPYVAVAAAALAYHAPRHGHCQMNVLDFLLEMQKSIKLVSPGSKLSDDQVLTYLVNYILDNDWIPGFGHSVHRITDPRYVAQQEFAESHLAWNPLVRLSMSVGKQAPERLRMLARARHPTPNSPLLSAPALYALGIQESNFHPVLAAASRAIGVGAALVWARAMHQPMERPRAVSTESLWLKYGMY